MESAKLCKRCHQPLPNLEVKVYSCPCGRTTKTDSLPCSLDGVIELDDGKQLEVDGAVLESYLGVPQHEMVNDLISIKEKIILLENVDFLVDGQRIKAINEHDNTSSE